MTVGQVGRPPVQVAAGRQALELDVVGRRLGIVLRRHGDLIIGRHGGSSGVISVVIVS